MPTLTETIQGWIALVVAGAAVSDANPLPVTAYDWPISHSKDETDDDSDKSATVPAVTEWQVLFIYVDYTSSGDVGDRQLVVEIQDTDGDVIHEVRAGITQAASLQRLYSFGPALADLTAERDTNWLMTPIPPTWVLQAGDVVRVYDNNVVAAAADDMHVFIQHAVRSI